MQNTGVQWTHLLGGESIIENQSAIYKRFTVGHVYGKIQNFYVWICAKLMIMYDYV